MQLAYIDYYTKSGDRKRYFKVAKYFYLQTLETYSDSLEKDLLAKMTTYNREHHPDKYMEEKSLYEISLDYHLTTRKLVNNSIRKINKYRKQEKES